MSFEFPLLKRNELVKTMVSMKFLPPNSVGNNPQWLVDCVVLETIYMNFVEALSSWDDKMPPKFNASRHLTHPELHEASVSRITFQSTLSKIMMVCGIKNFSMNDVVKPNGKRTIRNLSALVNYAKFFQNREEEYKHYSDELEGLEKEAQKVQAENKEIEASLENLRAQSELHAPELQGVKDAIQSTNETIRATKRNQTAMKNEIEQINRTFSQLSKQIENDKFDLMTKRKEMDEMRSQIVKSPEKYKKSVSNLKLHVEAKRQHATKQNTELQDVRKRCEVLVELNKNCCARYNSLQELVEVKMKRQDDEKTLKDLKQKSVESDKSMQVLNKQYESLKNRIETQSISMKDEYEEREKSYKDASDRYDEKMKQKREMTAEARVKFNEVLKLKAEIQKKRSELESLRVWHTEGMKEARDALARLTSHQKEFHQKMLSILETIHNFS